jgi:hypothetical protein
MLPLFCFLQSAASNQPPALTEKEKQNLQLIRELERFGKLELGLDLNRHFYKKWQKKEQQNTYLYLSRADSILLPKDTPAFQFFGTDTSGARLKADACRLEGLDVMIYKTSGTSAVLLTHQLLNYPSEAIVFIVLHEMAHIHRTEKKLKVSYACEESFGDFLGNVAGEIFVRKYHPEWLAACVRQRKIHETLYDLFRKIEHGAQGISLEKKKAIYTQAQLQLDFLLKSANTFQHDRFAYPINHAYILRNRYYYRWYNSFLLDSQSEKSLREMVDFYATFQENVMN